MDADVWSEEWAADQARFCLVMQMSPSEYKQLTSVEVNAFYKMYKKLFPKGR